MSEMVHDMSLVTCFSGTEGTFYQQAVEVDSWSNATKYEKSRKDFAIGVLLNGYRGLLVIGSIGRKRS